MTYTYPHLTRAQYNRPIWAVAYDTNDDTNRKRLRCLPVQGEINGSHFYPYLKDGKTLSLRGVQCYSRVYADTEQEAIQAYNELVQKRINKLQQLLREAKADYLAKI